MQTDHIDFISVGLKKPIVDKYTRSLWVQGHDEDELPGTDISTEEWQAAIGVTAECVSTFTDIANDILREYEGLNHITFWCGDSVFGLFDEGDWQWKGDTE